ncbi:MAG: substrate-binding domain-containing protein, partial [Bacillota bacterium]
VEDDIKKSLKMFKAARVAGVLVTVGKIPEEAGQYLQEMNNNGLPVIGLSTAMDYLDMSYIDTDRVEAGCKVGEHLIAEGHKRLGFIASSFEVSNSSAKKLEGLKIAAEKANIPIQDRDIYEGALDYDRAYEIACNILQKDDFPTAFFCNNDEAVLAFVRAARDHDVKIPDDVAIVGFDDAEFSAFTTPAISTVAQPCEEIGDYAAQLMLDFINNGEPEEREIKIFSSELKVRETS